jgi:RNA polymerase sigma-70 factor (ECF subfamily)
MWPDGRAHSGNRRAGHGGDDGAGGGERGKAEPGVWHVRGGPPGASGRLVDASDGAVIVPAAEVLPQFGTRAGVRDGVRDEAWLGHLLGRHWKDVLRQVGARLGDYTSDAEDVALEVFTVAWRRRHKVPEPPWPWLYTTARNLSNNHLRRQWAREKLYRLVGGRPPADDGGIPRCEQREDLTRAWRMLNSRERELMRLYHLEDMSHGEIAELVGSSPQAVRKRLSRARARLRPFLDPPTGDLGDPASPGGSRAPAGRGGVPEWDRSGDGTDGGGGSGGAAGGRRPASHAEAGGQQ